MKADNYVISKSGIKLYIDYKDNICCEDKDNRVLTDKAKIERENYTEGEAKGLCRFGSVSSEDALSWSVFRTLELKNKISLFYNLIGLDDDLQKTIFWMRDTSTGEVDPMLQEVLDEVEPRNLWKIQQTEPDVILISSKTVIFNESKLGYANTRILGWARSKNFEEKHQRYKNYLDGIFTNTFKDNFETLGVRFYQLMRNVIVGKCYAERLNREFHLSVTVNQLNTTDTGISHKDKLGEFSNYLIDNTKVHFTTWQDIGMAVAEDATLSDLSHYLTLHPCLKEIE